MDEQKPREFAKNVPSLLREAKNGCSPMFFFITCPEKAEELTASLEDNGNKLMGAYELIMKPNGQLNVCRDETELKKRASTGSNSCDQVAWEMKLSTPDKPAGRTVIVIASDISFRSGSYSMDEHNLYAKASVYSRKINYPRAFIAASSGGRIGLSPQEYLYANRDSRVPDQITFTEVVDHLKIDAVIGIENDIETENLVGSGLNAGETHRAYKEVPTFALVTGRCLQCAFVQANLSGW
ncbi:hypothetical protein QR680_000687 [Steinernema hermaphroditum]|uniref:Acetyl-coenzyme A carboxylase carboxyl transferase subunit beta domain-containing protein n=1 Tax=Steinernema hermaphroditum TaxID=289476 RepID=A0AA39LEM2_9BILA|nr:hypothetical protein QR680_000687 [Steinernema hermaphroditum]